MAGQVNQDRNPVKADQVTGGGVIQVRDVTPLIDQRAQTVRNRVLLRAALVADDPEPLPVVAAQDRLDKRCHGMLPQVRGEIPNGNPPLFRDMGRDTTLPLLRGTPTPVCGGNILNTVMIGKKSSEQQVVLCKAIEGVGNQRLLETAQGFVNPRQPLHDPAQLNPGVPMGRVSARHLFQHRHGAQIPPPPQLCLGIAAERLIVARQQVQAHKAGLLQQVPLLSSRGQASQYAK